MVQQCARSAWYLVVTWFGLSLATSIALAQQKKATSPVLVMPADLFVDDDNGGQEDGSAVRPFRTVQKAVDQAKDNAVIAVAGGVYAETISIKDKAVRLYGGYVGGTKSRYEAGTAGNFKQRDPAANTSHLKGNGKDSVVTMSESGASTVDGFLVSGGGRSTVAAPAFLGGGFYISGGSPTISNNVIENNRTCPPVKQDEEKLGGGIFATGANISILDNVIRNNVSGRGAGVAVDGRKVLIRGNLVEKNIAVSDHGGGLYLFSENAEISHNRVVGNEIGRELGYGWGGGIIVFNSGGNYKLSHNVFTGNYAPSLGSAVFVDDGASATMDHDLIFANADNPAMDGSVVAPVYVDGADDKTGSTLAMNHVTVVDHATKSLAKSYGVSVTGKSKVVVRNSIFWNNGGNDVFVDEISSATVSFTLGQTELKGKGNLSQDPLFADPAGHDYALRSKSGRWDDTANGKKGGWVLDRENSPAIDAADPASPFHLEPKPNGGRANLGVDGGTAQASKSDSEGPPLVKAPGPVAEGKRSKTMLLQGTVGDMPSEVGDDKTKMTKMTSKELGGTAIRIAMIDSFGQKQSVVEDWTPFDTLRLDMVNEGDKELTLELNLFHSETKAFATRVVAPIVLKPGKNDVGLAVKDLKNTNGSAPKLSEVRRWFVATETPVSLQIGDIFLEGKAGGGDTSLIKTDPARLKRIKAATLPKFDKPIAYDTPESDNIMTAADIFPADNPWNTLIEDWPEHANSKKIIASIGADKPLRYNTDMAFVIVPPDQKKVPVKLIENAEESDPGPYPVPDNIPIEGWPTTFQHDAKLKSLTLDDVQRGKPSLEEDRHGIVYDPVARKAYEFYRLTRTDQGWQAEQASVFDLSSNRLRPDGWTSADAAGLPILPAIVRYDEIKRGTIDHALRFTVRKSRRAYVYPATHFASKLTDEDLPRMGERFRLRKDFDISKFSPEARVILEALKRYGMFMADNGMEWGLSVSADPRLPNFHDELRRIKGSDFVVITPPKGYIAPK